MGKKSKATGKNYVSKGERPNVSRKLRNDIRRNRDSTVADLRKSDRMMSKDKKQMLREADTLYSQYGDRATWAACVQAVKTGYVASFKNKYYGRGTEQKKRSKGNQ